MKWISLVPSWTETWIELGFNVIGRTRYCIHPKNKVQNIPIIGGTKDIPFSKIRSLNPDIILIDKEENPKTILELKDFHFFTTHISDIKSIYESLDNLTHDSRISLTDEQSLNIELLKKRWDKVIKRKLNLKIESLPQILKWIHPIDRPIDKVAYIIWKNPFMVITANTYIGHTLKHLGIDIYPSVCKEKYPKINLQDIPEDVLLLFSSEPYDFLKEEDWIQSLNRPAAIVNGESYSWFGIRSLRFLESL